MKKLIYRFYILLIAALACGVATSAAVASPVPSSGSNPGRLVIYRSANLGSDILIDVNIDGKTAATLDVGKSYTGSLSPGQHVLSVSVKPKPVYLPETKKTLMVESGKTYTFTAKWQGQALVLR